MGNFLWKCMVSLSVVWCVLFAGVRHTSGQLVEQTFTLNPGWNAIFLEVQPEPRDPDTVFAGLPDALSVWRWNPRTSAVEYIQNPNTLVPDQPQWMVYFPPAQPESLLTNLYALRGGKAYLIKMGGEVPVEWTISGYPCLPKIEWKPDSVNLVGFHLSPASAPYFSDFFAPSSAHGNANPQVYRLEPGGTWKKVSSPSTTRMKQGESYWIYCDGASDYVGPLEVRVEQGEGLDYEEMLTEQKLRIKNHFNNPVGISLTMMELSPISLSRWVPVSGGDFGRWEAMSGPVSLAYVGGEASDIRLSVERSNLPIPGEKYHCLMEVHNNAGSRVLVPVYATRASRTGLWVGNATIDKVNQPSSLSDPDSPLPTASELQFRLIAHVDQAGMVRIIDEVFIMRNESGEFVLVGDDALIEQYSSSAIIGGKEVGRRISSAVFPQPVAMGGFFEAGGTVTGISAIGSDDPLNPFRHRYHPDHAAGYGVTRTISLEFTAVDPTGSSIAGWGDRIMGGIYRENLIGLHKAAINVEGTFRLHKVSDVGELE